MVELFQALFGLGLILFLFCFYMLPTIVAFMRNHKNIAPIAIVNFLLGWTLVGYAVALAWAFTAQDKS